MIRADRPENGTVSVDRPVLLFIGDRAVLSSLQFSLMLDGFVLENGAAEGASPFAAPCLVIDQRYRGDGLAFLSELRACGATAPAILLATNPTRRLHERARAAGANVIEKPLLGDELTLALQTILDSTKLKPPS